MLLQLEVMSLLNSDGYLEDLRTRWLVVAVEGGRVFDHSYRDLEYSLLEDGCLQDWTGGEWEFTAESVKELRDAVTKN